VRRSILSACLILLVTACATDRARIDIATTTCCASPDYKTFTVTAQDIPAFLGPLMMSNFTVAFAAIGMQPVTSDGDVNVILRFEQVSRDPQDVKKDDFQEHLAAGDAMRFMARIVVDVHDGKTGKVVWSGHIQRLHDVGAGEYMHTGPASIAIYQAFQRLLTHYPKG